MMRALLALASIALALPAAAAQEELTLGRISDDPRSHYAQLQPLLDYVVPRMADVGIRRGRILMARDLRQMVNHLRHDRVDWVTETAGMAMQLHALADARPILLTERSGVREYSSVIVARADGPIRTMADLAGRNIAFEHRASTSAYLVPASDLIAAGLSLEPLATLGDVPVRNGVGYLFARSEPNIAIWVDKGLVDAGAISSLGWSNPQTVPAPVRERLAVVHESRPVPRALELTRDDFHPALARRLREVLLAAPNDPEAAPALRAFFGTTQFLPIDAEVQQRLDELHADMLRVGAEVD